MATHSSILAWRIPTDRGAWRATVHGVTESNTTEQLSIAQHRDFPGGSVVKNRPASARAMGSIPGGSHVPQGLSLCSRAREPQLLSPCATATEIAHLRATAMRNLQTTIGERTPLTATRESPRSNKDPVQPKKL